MIADPVEEDVDFQSQIHLEFIEFRSTPPVLLKAGKESSTCLLVAGLKRQGLGGT